MLTQTQVTARRDQINKLIDSAGATILAVEFFKLDGAKRTINVQLPVAKFHVVGDASDESRKAAKITRKENNPNLRNLWDLARKGFRSVNLDTVISVSVRGTRFDIGPVASAAA